MAKLHQCKSAGHVVADVHISAMGAQMLARWVLAGACRWDVIGMVVDVSGDAKPQTNAAMLE